MVVKTGCLKNKCLYLSAITILGPLFFLIWIDIHLVFSFCMLYLQGFTQSRRTSGWRPIFFCHILENYWQCNSAQYQRLRYYLKSLYKAIKKVETKRLYIRLILGFWGRLLRHTSLFLKCVFYSKLTSHWYTLYGVYWLNYLQFTLYTV